MIQVILYRLVYGVQGCICNENIFYWFATHYTGQFATMNFAGQEYNEMKYSQLKIDSNILEKEIKETNHKI